MKHSEAAFGMASLTAVVRAAEGRLTSVSAQLSGDACTLVASSVAYEPFGPDTGFRSGNAGQETRGFDQDYRLTNVTDLGTVRRGVTRVLQNLSYAYYPTNNVQTITDAVNSTNDQSFSYDNLQRLSAATGGYGTFGFTYDNDGNRLSQTFGTVTTNYGYGTGSDLLATTSVGGTTTQTLGYTADGRMASLSPGIQAPGGQFITSLSYNQDAQLATVNSSNGALASYTYDGFGQRLLKTISGTYGEIYQYGQDGMLLEETNASGVAQADYLYLDGRPIATLDPSSGSLYFLHDDLLGTPQLATDGTQNTAWQASYEPFGQTSSVSGSITQNLRLPGQYYDLESGWNHNGFRDYLPDLGRYAEPDPLAMQGSARIYNPTSGRFISEEPVGFAGSVANLYAYADNSPTNFTDPLGLQDSATPWQVGWEWLTGTGPRVHNFTDGDPFTELLRHHQHVQDLINDVCNGTLPPNGQFNYNLGGLGGVPKYLQDYSTLFTGGLTGNLAVTYLGSYALTYSETNGVLDIQVTNTSSIASATHPPVVGYTNWWNNNIGTPLNNFFSSGPMSATTQNFDFHENLAGRGCACELTK
jgi:RHS repeat-associated protein